VYHGKKKEKNETQGKNRRGEAEAKQKKRRDACAVVSLHTCLGRGVLKPTSVKCGTDSPQIAPPSIADANLGCQQTSDAEFLLSTGGADKISS